MIGIGSAETLGNGSQLWKDWLSTINVIEKSDLTKKKSKKKTDRPQQAVSEQNQEQASISKSGFDHDEAKHSAHQRSHQHPGRHSGRSHYGNYPHSSSDRRQRDDHDGVAYDSYRGNRRGMGRTPYRSSDHRQTDHEDRSRYRGRHHSPQAEELVEDTLGEEVGLGVTLAEPADQ